MRRPARVRRPPIGWATPRQSTPTAKAKRPGKAKTQLIGSGTQRQNTPTLLATRPEKVGKLLTGSEIPKQSTTTIQARKPAKVEKRPIGWGIRRPNTPTPRERRREKVGTRLTGSGIPKRSTTELVIRAAKAMTARIPEERDPAPTYLSPATGMRLSGGRRSRPSDCRQKRELSQGEARKASSSRDSFQNHLAPFLGRLRRCRQALHVLKSRRRYCWWNASALASAQNFLAII